MQNEYILSEEVKNAIIRSEETYKITEAEKFEILKQILIDQVGYQKAQALYETAIEFYNPIRYAVRKTKESLEKR